MNARAWLVVLVLGLGLGCGPKAGGSTTTNGTQSGGSGSGTSASNNGSAPELTGVGIALDVQPKDAKVTIDEIVMGRADQLDPVVSLAPGLHTLVVDQPGFKSYRAEFSVTDRVEKFTVRLEPKK
jgi:hypothetical protein